ncbi:histidyl-tRNA synthetase [Amycolatopsis mediterranei S699]|uniref:Histidine--tRNA ligase n=2 Tax=Amycolatopsis mediterranei TaxID=33910 RepID=A0A0H3CWM3_AMYMU|nr:histidine--tRNA ligase [Amycolatopsis mediterranei]ADJ42718.1 histidyl-tRNA synthetase [Amycolatopsis mediterranei U32]AEK39409.1 histidyl-tRNA synthetase [Amycolatopsis mediterranei S699]AFO74432.1 histidyl-tRNA synthetase [Amycolatopsis mediterranei S699]AGT81561.1 histidyl-tRNA synthetase [Amycolatopsis mediterranei RB]KDO09982.1 histidyl-tRNA synthetase [Amycolatopsis mediterranei]
MPEYLPTAPYKGTRDFLPAEMSVRTQVFGHLYDVLERRGFLRYDGPILESAEIYERKSGQELADKQLYTLTDKGGRRLALRPEMTPSVARMIAGSAKSLSFPVRWYSHPNCHRYEAPQRGRVREHWQINADIFGSDSANCEIEIFELVHDMMAALGATPDMFVLRVNDRNLLTSALTDVAGVSADHLSQVFALVDRWEKYPREKLAESAGEIGLSDKQFEKLAETLDAGEALLDELPAEVRAESNLVRVLNSSAGSLVKYEPIIVRGLAYYTSTVFEVFDTSPENRRALFGGGRYSDLASMFTPQQIPGIGFGMGDVTLIDFLDTHGLTPAPRSEVDVMVIPVTEDLADAARSVAGSLRQAGLRTSTPIEHRKLGKELTRADKAGAVAVVIVGQEDWAAGNVTVRSLATREQNPVAVADAPAAVRALLA